MNRDRVSKEKRSEIMSKIRSSRTKPELRLKSVLDSVLESLPFVAAYLPPAPYKPDFIVCGRRTAMFMDGMFWHGYLPIPMDQFWIKKITRNIMRDREANNYYTSYGWDVIRVKEHTVTKSKPGALEDMLRAHLAMPVTGSVWTL